MLPPWREHTRGSCSHRRLPKISLFMKCKIKGLRSDVAIREVYEKLYVFVLKF